jgi:hypothetical protein
MGGHGKIVDVSYPVTFLALTAEDADALRDRHASGDDAAVLARVRELAASSAEQLTIDKEWEPIRRCLVGSDAVIRSQSVFGRRDYLIALPAHGYEGRADETGFDYTWYWFERMRAFFRKTADEGRPLVFTADQ